MRIVYRIRKGHADTAGASVDDDSTAPSAIGSLRPIRTAKRTTNHASKEARWQEVELQDDWPGSSTRGALESIRRGRGHQGREENIGAHFVAQVELHEKRGNNGELCVIYLRVPASAYRAIRGLVLTAVQQWIRIEQTTKKIKGCDASSPLDEAGCIMLREDTSENANQRLRPDNHGVRQSLTAVTKANA